MSTVNRAVAVVKPKQPYLDWTKQIAAGPNEIHYKTLEEARRDCTAFLIPVVEFDEDIPQLLRHYAEEIFEEQLWSWDQREEQWPKQRDFKTLMEWFDVEVATIVIDLDEIPLVVENY